MRITLSTTRVTVSRRNRTKKRDKIGKRTKLLIPKARKKKNDEEKEKIYKRKSRTPPLKTAATLLVQANQLPSISHICDRHFFKKAVPLSLSFSIVFLFFSFLKN